jgi:hypothetical protein
MTPSGLSIGIIIKIMLLRIYLERRFWGSRRFSIIPSIIQELQASPGWILAEITTIFLFSRGISLFLKSVRVNYGTAIPLRLLQRAWYLTKQFSGSVGF